jgi:hypothetical protein
VQPEFVPLDGALMQTTTNEVHHDMNNQERLRLLAERGITQEWLEEKGHLPEVALARGYYRVSKDSAEDLARFQAEYQSLPQPWQKAFMTRLAKQQDGLMRPHYPPPGMQVELRKAHPYGSHIFTQFRPDDDVRTGAWQDHEPHWAVKTWRYHLVRHEDHGNRDMTNTEVDALTAEEISAIASTGKLRWMQKHRHIDTGRFINTPSPKRDHAYKHDHATAYRHRPKLLEKHIERQHEGRNVLGPHSHELRVNDERYEYAKRLDVNPLVTEEILRAAEVLVFVIEGAVKADTALSEIIRNDWTICGRPAVVFSCPAVGQWGARELEPFMELYGQGTTAFIVADSDAYENPDVMTQAFLCRAKLERLGAADAYVTVPEEVFGEGVKAGLDDAVGEGSTLDRCIIQHRDPGPWDQTYTTMFADFPRFSETRIEARNNATSLVHSTSVYVDPATGDYKASQRAQARPLGWPHRRVGRTLHNLQVWGCIEIIEGSLDVGPSDYSYEDIYNRTPVQRLHVSLGASAWQQTIGDFFAERDEKRTDMTAIATEEQLAQDAERVAEMAQEIFSIALRWQARFPKSRVLQATVDRFLAEVLTAS